MFVYSLNKIIMNNDINDKIIKKNGNKNETNNRITKKMLFNSLAHECVNTAEIPIIQRSNKNALKYGSEKDYQESFIEDKRFQEFLKKNKDIKKDRFNYICYHKDNADGLSGAYIIWRYLTNDGKKEVKDIIIRALDPGYSAGDKPNERLMAILHEMRDKNVIGIDLSYNLATLEAISKTAKSFIWIDDHDSTTNTEKQMPDNVFVSNGHCASTYVFKFFYPTKSIPVFLQYVDNNDYKLFLPFTPYSDYFSLAYGVRVTNNARYNLAFKQSFSIDNSIFSVIHKLFPDDNLPPNFLIYIGNFFNELRENQKYELVNLAVPQKWLGYNIAILNFDSPSLGKVVGREMITTMRKRGNLCDFSVLWSYHYVRKEYRIQMMNDHTPNAPDMGHIARQLSKLPGAGKQGGSGHKNVGNLYWKDDIFKLFNMTKI